MIASQGRAALLLLATWGAAYGAGCLDQGPPADEPDDSDEVGGDEQHDTSDGAPDELFCSCPRLAFDARIDRARSNLSDRMYVNFSLRNVGEGNATVVEPRPWVRFSVVDDANGTPPRPIGPGLGPMPILDENLRVLAPGESWESEGVFTSRHAFVDGRYYEFTFSYVVLGKPPLASGYGCRGVLESAEVVRA